MSSKADAIKHLHDSIILATSFAAKYPNEAPWATLISMLKKYETRVKDRCGVSLAFESELKIPHSLFFSSPLELIDLGDMAVVQIFLESGMVLKNGWETMGNIYASSWKVLVLFVVFLAILSNGIIYLAHKKNPETPLKKPKRQTGKTRILSTYSLGLLRYHRY